MKSKELQKLKYILLDKIEQQDKWYKGQLRLLINEAIIDYLMCIENEENSKNV